MNKALLVRILAGIMFLIFLCPFFQTCSDKSMMKSYTKQEMTVEEGMTDAEIAEIVSANAGHSDTEKNNALEEARKEHTLNGYELAVLPFKDGDRFDAKDIVYQYLSFPLQLFISAALFVFALKKSYRKVFWLGIISVVNMIMPLIIFYFGYVLEDINQIKYGYYLFIINSVVIVYLSYKANIKLQNNAP